MATEKKMEFGKYDITRGIKRQPGESETGNHAVKARKKPLNIQLKALK